MNLLAASKRWHKTGLTRRVGDTGSFAAPFRLASTAIANGRCVQVEEALRAEFGAIVAERILEAEAADFLWDACVKERDLRQHLDVGMCDFEREKELARVAVLSCLAGRWHAATCLVDDEGMAVDLLWKRSFERVEEAQAAFDRAA